MFPRYQRPTSPSRNKETNKSSTSPTEALTVHTTQIDIVKRPHLILLQRPHHFMRIDRERFIERVHLMLQLRDLGADRGQVRFVGEMRR